MLHAAQSRADRARRELRSAPARNPHPAQGDQGRLAPLRAELLPQIPARGAIPGAGRHFHVSPRLPLHRPADRDVAGRAAPRVRPRVRAMDDVQERFWMHRPTATARRSEPKR